MHNRVKKKDDRFLFNQKDREQLKADLAEENFKRRTCSFYRYIFIDDPQVLRDELYKDWFNLRILGRVYIATEGINAQKRKHEISGLNNTFYCGAYWRNGFHEDGVVSALEVCSHFGITL